MILYQILGTIIGLAIYDLFVKLPVTKAWEKFKNRTKE